MLSHGEMLRARFRDAKVGPAPPPWRPPAAAPRGIAVGGLLGVGFHAHPETGADLLLVASSRGRGLFDCATGERLARDRADDYDEPDGPDLSCAGIGVLAGRRVRMAGLYGGGLHHVTPDAWTIRAVAPAWPNQRVMLVHPFHEPAADPDRGGWHVIYDDRPCELRAAGFAPSGNTLVVASSCDVVLFVRP